MFCSNCGNVLADEAKFCSNCGAKSFVAENDSITLETSQATTVSKEPMPMNAQAPINMTFNRDVLSNYMCNIRTLEIAKSSLIAQKENITYRISNLGYSQNMYEPGADGESIVYALLGGGGFIVVVLIVGTLLKETVGKWFDWTGFLSGLMAFLIIGTIIIAGGYIIYELFSTFNAKKDYEYRKKQDELRVQNELNERIDLQEIADELDKEIEETDKLLCEAYSVNLIPSKYRNVYAAYFLYDYISTSNATLSEALLHCDLDTIIENLKTVIAQQSEMIMELAATNAKNEAIIQQNEQMLHHAIQTENNTALAAQYGQIAATNSKVTAYCQMVQFLEK